MVKFKPKMTDIGLCGGHDGEVGPMCRQCLAYGDEVYDLTEAIAWYEQHICEIEACPICGRDDERRVDRSYSGRRPWDICETPCIEQWRASHWATTNGKPDLNGLHDTYGRPRS